MAKQKSYSAQDKCDYYAKRANNPRLSEAQRRYAQKRLSALCGGKKSAPTKSAVAAPSRSVNSPKHTDGEKYAYGAGIGYAAAKAGKRVDVKPENRQSFRDGLARGRQIRN